jgi:hypothetical protein
MSQQKESVPRVESPVRPVPRHEKALHLLKEARLAALSEQLDIWQFAVEIEQLRALGLSHTDLRSLLLKGYLEHARERTRAGTSQRFFQPLRSLVLPKRTCFVLTAKGLKIASEFCLDKKELIAARAEDQAAERGTLSKVPRWDGKSRQLWWLGRLVKEFHRPAVNQELILAAMEEEGWPMRIDDPLPRIPDIDPKMRLHDTIKSLNRHCLHPEIFFRGDGSGRGICWVASR